MFPLLFCAYKEAQIHGLRTFHVPFNVSVATKESNLPWFWTVAESLADPDWVTIGELSSTKVRNERIIPSEAQDPSFWQMNNIASIYLRKRKRIRIVLKDDHTVKAIWNDKVDLIWLLWGATSTKYQAKNQGNSHL
jgi:hypothetical protein